MAQQYNLETVISLRDEFSKRLAAIRKSLEQLQREMVDANRVSTKSINSFASALHNLESTVKNATNSTRNQFRKHANDTARALGELKHKSAETFDSIAKKARDSSKNMMISITTALAKIAGSLYVFKEAFDLAEETAKAAQAYETFYMIVRQRGEDVKRTFDEIREASGGLISTDAIIEASNRAAALGIPINKIAELMEVARYRARLMGTDVKSAFNDLVVGIGRASPMILDNLGFTIKLGEAYDEYAKQLKKSADELTNEERKQALLNYVLKEGAKTVELMGKRSETAAEKFQRMHARMEDLRGMIGTVMIPVFNALGEIFIKLSPIILRIAEGWRMLVETISSFVVKLSIAWDWVKSGFEGGFDELSKKFEKQTDKWAANIKRIQKDFESTLGTINWENVSVDIPKELPTVRPKLTVKPDITIDEETKRKMQEALEKFNENIFNATADSLAKRMHAVDKWYKQQIELARQAGLEEAAVAEALQRIVEEKKAKIRDEYRARQLMRDTQLQSQLANVTLTGIERQLEAWKKLGKINEFDYLMQKAEVLREKIEALKFQLHGVSDPMQWQTLNNQIAELSGRLEEVNARLNSLNRSNMERFKDGLRRYVNEFKSVGEKLEELSYNSAKAMERTFSDFFFDAMQGKLKSLSDYFHSFTRTVMRYIADIMAKMMALKILGSFGFKVGKLHDGGVVTRQMVERFNASNSVRFETIKRFHDGGKVVQREAQRFRDYASTVPLNFRKYHDGGLVSLASDEVPAILQVGEVVLSRKQVKELSGTRGTQNVNISVNVTNETGAPIDVDVQRIAETNEQHVIDIVVRHINNNPAFRQIVRGR